MEDLHINILDPGTARFSEGTGGVLQLKIEGKAFYPRVWIYRSYPLNKSEGLLSVRDASHEDFPEIGLIVDIKEFPADMQQLILAELEKRYFVPVIGRVISIKEVGDRLDWDVETDRGRRQFVVRSPYENIRPLNERRLLITDIYNCRYEMKDYHCLDNKQKGIIGKYIYL
ncbi:MAG: DUF1854 domain-containing protein [Nitrospirota bacterium]